jgi:hypothetical protein
MSAKPLFYLWHWHLSHTVRRNRAKNRIQTTFTGVLARFFGVSGAIRPGLSGRQPHHRGEQNESESRERAFKAGRKGNGCVVIAMTASDTSIVILRCEPSSVSLEGCATGYAAILRGARSARTSR